jgi:hypothetical protein
VARGDKVDGSAFFRVLEIHSRTFLKWYEEKRASNPAQYPPIMAVRSWWGHYRKWEEERKAADAAKAEEGAA